MHFASYYRWLVYQHLFETPGADISLLDIGCDDGGFVERLGARMSVALDPSLGSLRKARAAFKVCGDGTRVPFGRVLFDYVVLSDVIEHVPDDAALVRNVTSRIKPGGVLWLSTTASQFQLFPASITPRAERSWGHVRKGYTGERLLQLIGDQFSCELVEWPEVVFRHSYQGGRLAFGRSPALARGMARACFGLDARLRERQRRHGHLYIRAVRNR